MKAAIISLGGPSSGLVGEAMRKYFDEVDMLDIRQIEVNLGSKEMEVLYQGKKIEQYDCVYTRGSYKYVSILRSLATALRSRGVFMPIVPEAITLGHDKFLTQLVLQENKIAMPSVYMAPTGPAAKQLLEKINYPVVIKIPHGTQGKGVMFADNYASAAALLDALSVLNHPFILQEYVETGGSDIRAIVVGDKVVASMRRQADVKEMRANIHAGGEGTSIELDSRTKQIAVKTAKAIGAEVCGVDLLEGPTGAKVIEINVSPGLKGVIKATGINVPDKIAKYLFERTKSIKEGKTVEGTKEIFHKLTLDKKEESQEIITSLDFRGNRVLLPEVLTNIAKFKESDEFTVEIKRGRICIRKN